MTRLAKLLEEVEATGERRERPLTPAELADASVRRVMGRRPTGGKLVAWRAGGRMFVEWAFAKQVHE